MIFSPVRLIFGIAAKGKKDAAFTRYDTISLDYADWVPPSMPSLQQNTKCVFVQDNDAVIKMVVKARAPTLKHVSRTHRIDLDWLFERIQKDPCIFGRYIHTKLQIADMLTKGNFTSEQWLVLCSLMRLSPPPKMKEVPLPPPSVSPPKSTRESSPKSGSRKK